MIKLIRILNFLKNTKNNVLILYADNNQYFIDMKRYADTIFTLGKEAVISDSTKQKLNTRSLTESELARINEKFQKFY